MLTCTLVCGRSYSADTWYWTGRDTTAIQGNAGSWGYDAGKSANWTNLVTKKQGVPKAGDIIAFSSDYAVAAHTAGIGIYGKLDNLNYAFAGVRWEKGQRPICQSTLYLAKDGYIEFTSGAASSTWSCNIVCNGTNIVNMASGKNLKLDGRRMTGSTATLIKEGAGSLIANTSSSYNQPCDVETVLLRNGSFGLHYGNIKEIRFDSNEPDQRLQLGTRVPNNNDKNVYGFYGVFLAEGGVLSESESVKNTSHGITSDYGMNLNFTGRPKVKDMVFTGTFYGSAGIMWNPSDADYVFSFKKADHQTTGLISVSNGTVRVCDGARFTKLSRVEVDGSSSRFRIETSGGFPMPAATVDISNGGKLALLSGVRVSVASVRVDGTAVPSGFYHGEGAESIHGSVKASWIDGSGYVAVGLAAASKVTAVWTGSGEDTLSDNEGNWSSSAPNLADGSAYVKVTGGNGFTAANDVWVNGFDLTDVNTFTFGSDSGSEIMIGAGGISGGAGTYSVNAPFAVSSKQLWNFRENATVNFNVPFAPGIGATEIDISGTGVTYNVNASLGPTNFAVNLEHRAHIFISAGVTNNADIRIYNDVAGDYWGNWPSLLFSFRGGKPTVMNGFMHNTNTSWRLEFMENADVTFNQTFLSRNSTFITYVGPNARVRFNKPFLCRNIFGTGTSFSETAVVELNAEGNCLGYANPWRTGEWGPFKKGTIRLLVPYALKDMDIPAGTFEYMGSPIAKVTNAGRFHMSENGVLDLYGNEQSLSCFYAEGGKVTSETDAIMTLNDKTTWNQTTGATRVDKAIWDGGAGLVFNGGNADWPRYMMTVSSTTGRLEVVNGRLVFPASAGNALKVSVGAEANATVARPAADAAWPKCSSVTVRGGTLELEHSKTFGRKVIVKFVKKANGTYGKIKLASGVNQSVGAIEVDGVALPCGTYGASGSGAEYERPELFASGGTGVLSVVGNGLRIVVR